MEKSNSNKGVSTHAGATIDNAKSSPLYSFLLKEAGLGDTKLSTGVWGEDLTHHSRSQTAPISQLRKLASPRPESFCTTSTRRVYKQTTCKFYINIYIYGFKKKIYIYIHKPLFVTSHDSLVYIYICIPMLHNMCGEWCPFHHFYIANCCRNFDIMEWKCEDLAKD